ncbi:mCG144744, partial [Mus musculus]
KGPGSVLSMEVKMDGVSLHLCSSLQGGVQEDPSLLDPETSELCQGFRGCKQEMQGWQMEQRLREWPTNNQPNLRPTPWAHDVQI